MKEHCVPVSLIKYENFNAVEVKRRSIAQVINKSSRCRYDDVRWLTKCCLLRLYIKPTYKPTLSSLKQHHKLQWLWRHLASKFSCWSLIDASTQKPTYHHNVISYHQPSRLLHSSSKSLRNVPRIKTDFGHCAFSLLLHKSGTIYFIIFKIAIVHKSTQRNIKNNKS